MPTNGVDEKLVFDAQHTIAGNGGEDDDDEVDDDDGAKIVLYMRISTLL